MDIIEQTLNAAAMPPLILTNNSRKSHGLPSSPDHQSFSLPSTNLPTAAFASLSSLWKYAADERGVPVSARDNLPYLQHQLGILGLFPLSRGQVLMKPLFLSTTQRKAGQFFALGARIPRVSNHRCDELLEELFLGMLGV